MLLLIGSITLGYFINKTLNPSRAFSVGLTSNTEAIPTIVEEEPAFTMEEELDDEYVLDEEPITETPLESAPFKIWDNLEEFEEKFNEAALIMHPSMTLGEMTVKEGIGGNLLFTYDFSDTHTLGGMINPIDGSIGGVTIYIINDETPETLENFLDTVSIAVASTYPLSEINMNVEDILIDLLWEDVPYQDFYNMDSIVDLNGINYSISSETGYGIWFSIQDSQFTGVPKLYDATD